MKSFAMSGGIPTASLTYKVKVADCTAVSDYEIMERGILTKNESFGYFYFFPLPLSATVESVNVKIDEMSFGSVTILEEK